MKNKALAMFMAIALIAMAGNAFAEPVAVRGDGECVADSIYGQSGEYIGCATCVGGHCAVSNPKQITEFGCGTFCKNLMA